VKNIDKENLEKNIQELFYKKDTCFDINYTSTCSDYTKELGIVMAKYLCISDIIVLNGELGSGKTVFVSGIAKYFEIENQVSSPTFTIVNEYTSKKNNNNLKIFHFDVYRIKSIDEFEADVGTDYFYNGICLIEWGDIIKEILPKNTIYIDISKDSENENIRNFHIWRK
jgi:tRNA threonylcarbamoyladenosine biosynthesis protein TsaE